MSERKAINKYYPPDYDPAKAEKAARALSKRLKSSGQAESSVRLMTPFSMRCLKCDEYIPKSRKFNGKKKVLDERYLGSIKMYRFSIRCPQCANTIAFRTDPRSADYVVETGGVRNYVQRPQEDAKAQGETLQQTLERLAREKEEETAAVAGGHRPGDPTRSKVELLEERLSKVQKQQRDAEELDRLIERNHRRLENSQGPAAPAATTTTTTAEQEEEERIDNEVVSAFASAAELPDAVPNAMPNAMPDKDDTTARADVTALSLPTKITLKSKKKSFGIVKKKSVRNK